MTTATEPMDDYTGLMDVIVTEESEQAASLSGYLATTLRPSSVIDVGCGPGLYLPPFRRSGATVFGIDGCETAGSMLQAGEFERVDLRCFWHPTRRYELALCIEVGEHLHEEYADGIVDVLCRCSDAVFFTAATPGQGGWFHHNEQPQDYWIEKFAARGYRLGRENDALQEHLATGPYLPWLKANSMLFERAN